MISLLKDSFKPLYWHARSKSRREFNRLLDTYGKKTRFMQCPVTFYQYHLDVPDCLSFIWQFKEIFDSEIYHFTARNDAPVIFDCGANVGMGCLYFKRLYPKARIKAYEADENVARLLRSNLLKNGIQDVEVIAKAVWTDDTGVNFGKQGADGGSVYHTRDQQRIDSVRLRNELEQVPHVDLLKIDIEGAETDVLNDCGNVLSRVDHIFVEYHSFKGQTQKLDQVLRVLSDNGFRYYIESFSTRKSPLDIIRDDKRMDLQLNIWGHRGNDEH